MLSDPLYASLTAPFLLWLLQLIQKRLKVKGCLKHLLWQGGFLPQPRCHPRQEPHAPAQVWPGASGTVGRSAQSIPFPHSPSTCMSMPWHCLASTGKINFSKSWLHDPHNSMGVLSRRKFLPQRSERRWHRCPEWVPHSWRCSRLGWMGPGQLNWWGAALPTAWGGTDWALRSLPTYAFLWDKNISLHRHI